MHNNQWQWIEAGRMQSDNENINNLTEMFKRKVLDLISLCQFKTIVLDFDGTLTEFKYDTNKLLPCKDDNINEYFECNNFYKNCNILKTFQFIIEELAIDTDNIYILTASQPNVKKHKLECIKKHFPIIKEENVIQVMNSNDKMEILKQIYNSTKRDILFVEDTAKTLLNAEEEYDFVKGYHISSLIP